MESSEAVSAFSALSQDTRLAALKVLVKHEPDGLPAGLLARNLGVPQNTLSSHLAILARANLVTSKRYGRVVTYRGNMDAVQQLVLHLVKDCCDGHPELCEPLALAIPRSYNSRGCC